MVTALETLLILFLSTCIHGQCTCNIDINVCDKGCCCDSQCSSEDLVAFNSCNQDEKYFDEKFCYYTNLFSTPLSQVLLRSKDNHTCLQIPNYFSSNFYQTPLLIASQEDALQVSKKFSSIIQSSYPSRTRYLSHDPIFIIRPDFNIEKLTFLNMIEAKFLVDYSYEDTIDLTTILNDCSQLPSYDSFDFGNFIKNPSYIDSVYDITSLKTNLNYKEFSISPTKRCVSSDGTVITCQKNTIDCKQVFGGYYIYILIENSAIKQIIISFIIKDFTSTKAVRNFGIYFYAKFPVKFPLARPSRVMKKSGNPGYQFKAPVLFATKTSEGRVTIKEYFLDNSLYQKVPGTYSSTYAFVSAGGACTDQAGLYQYPLVFGENSVSHCYHHIDVNLGSTTSGGLSCNSLEQTIKESLFKGFPTDQNTLVFNIFGNGTSLDQHWYPVKILDLDFVQGKSPEQFPRLCRNIIKDLNIQISLQQMSDSDQPILGIVGVVIQINRGIVQFKCYGNSCQGTGIQQKVFSKTTVNFEITNQVDNFYYEGSSDDNYRFPFIGNSYNNKIEFKKLFS